MQGMSGNIIVHGTTKVHPVITFIPGHALRAGYALHEKGLRTKTNRRRYIDQQPKTKGGRRPGNKPVINRGLCSPSGLNRISLVRASEALFRTVVHDSLERTRDGCVLPERTRRRPILRSPPHPAAPPCAPDPDRPCCVRVLDSTSTATNKRRYTGQQPGTKSPSRPAEKPRGLPPCRFLDVPSMK